MTILPWRGLDELHARLQAWERWLGERYKLGEAPPTSPRDAYFAGWKDRAEWGSQEIEIQSRPSK